MIFLKKIVFVLGNYKDGGMAIHATNLSIEFAKRGYCIDILATGEVGESFLPKVSRVNVVSLKEYQQMNKGKKLGLYTARLRKINTLKRLRYLTRRFKAIDKKLEKKKKYLQRGMELSEYFVNENPDIVIPFGFSYLESTVSACEGLDCKLFYAEKNAPETEFPEKGSDDYYYYMSLLRRISGVIVQTKDEKSFFPDDLDNITVINNILRQGLPPRYSGKRRKSIVNFCRISSQKNLELLIDAFARIHEAYPDYIVQVYGNVVGKREEEYKRKIIRKIKEMGLENYVFVYPPRADVHQKVIDSAMFVSSSDFEGLSNSMLEAMAIGLPCICTDCLGGGTREVMRDKENGLIVPMNDAEALADAMKLYIENPDFAEKCGENAAKIRDRLAVDKIAQEWIDFFRR